MSEAQEQANRERINELIRQHRVPNHGKLHIIDDIEGTTRLNVLIDPGYQPERAAFMFVRKNGDEQYYDVQGFEIYAD